MKRRRVGALAWRGGILGRALVMIPKLVVPNPGMHAVR
jgi:hypothetical protein